MKLESKNFRAVLLLLWLRLITVAVIVLLFAATLLLSLPTRIEGWFYYLTIWEVLFEVAVRLVAVALIGAAGGTLVTAVVAPFLFRSTSRGRFAEKSARTAVAFASFGVFAMVLKALVEWAGLTGSSLTAIVLACYSLAFAVALGIPRTREALLTSLDDFLSERAARRTGIAIAIATVAVVAGEWMMGMAGTAIVQAAPAARPSGPNILLITFDALSADEMSLYGYRLSTTPRLEEFARKSTVFTSFFSASTFTTSAVATILTGMYPSEHHVYHLQGSLTTADAGKTLPYLLRGGNYITGASISNPYAYFLAAQIARQYNAFPDPPYRNGVFTDVWDAMGMLHQRQPFGSRAREFKDFEQAWDSLPAFLERHDPRRFGRKSGFPPSATFAQAQEVLAGMPAGFFLWVHVLAPHGPYLPDPPYLGRFLPSDEMRTEEEQAGFDWWPHYPPSSQKRVDKARLRYDEFIAQADDAVGAFLTGLESAGRLRDTAVIISADHGESFEGGLYTHASKYQTRPEIHIPLIVHMPGQEHGSRVAITADQTSLASTILDIAGLPRPDWMRGRSLLLWLNGDHEEPMEGLAFTQYLETNSIFKPLNSGTVGVIDGREQYVLDLATDKVRLRGLEEAQLCDLDRSAENPALARRLREAIYARFPDLPRKSE